MYCVMDIRQAFSGLLGSPHLIALRAGGPIVTVTNRDFCATDWQIVTAQQLGQLAAAAQQAPQEG